jgi:hypothetical protein
MKHSHGRGIVGEKQRTAFAGAPPLALLTVGELPSREAQTDVSIEESRLIESGLRARWQAGVVVDVVEDRLDLGRILCP